VLLVVGLATLAFAAIGGLAARDLRTLAAWMICGSAGTLLMLVGVGTHASLGAALFYLPHATFAAAALMLVAGLLASARGTALADRFEAGPRPAGATLLGTLFVVCGLASAGLPPFSGFVAKAILLDSVIDSPAAVAIWIVVLGASLAWVVALSRGGSLVFWKSAAAPEGAPLDEAQPAAFQPGELHEAEPRPGAVSAIVLLAAAGVAIVLFAAPLARHFARAGAQLQSPSDYREAVLGRMPVSGTAPAGVAP